MGWGRCCCCCCCCCWLLWFFCLRVWKTLRNTRGSSCSGHGNLSPSIMQLFVYLEVTPSIASILELKRKRIKRAIFVGSVTWWGLLRIWMYVWRCQVIQDERDTLKLMDFIAIYLAFLIVYGVCICFRLCSWRFQFRKFSLGGWQWFAVLHCMQYQRQIAFVPKLWTQKIPKVSRFQKWIESFRKLTRLWLLFLEAFWSALGLALVPFHDDLRADPVALLLGVSAKVCAPTDFLASSYSKVIQ